MNSRFSKIVQNPSFAPVITGLIGLGVGAGVGYILGKRTVPTVIENGPLQMEFQYEDTVKSDDSFEGSEDVEPELGLPVQTLDLGERFVSRKVIDEAPPISVDDPIVHNMFAESDDEWDFEYEISLRSEALPYILHKDEFYADELGYEQTTLTYYAGDDILVDEEEAPIYNHTSIVGPMKFGHGSGDQNTFHVRNHKLKAEYEIIFDPGLYSVEVLGLEIENNQRARDLKHSRDRRFRSDD